MASPETTRATQTAVCDLLLQYLAEYETTHIVILESTSYHSACPLSGPALSRFLTHSPAIKGAELTQFGLDVEQCRALVAIENHRDGFEITLSYCSLTEAGEPVLFEGIRRNRGPTTLHGCRFNMRPFAEALRGNTRIKQFGSGSDVSITDGVVLFLLQALAENIGIEKLDLSYLSINDESWDVMCQSLANHPATEYIRVDWHNEHSRPPSSTLVMPEAKKTYRTQCLVEMLKVNTVVKEIDCLPDDRDQSIWRNEIVPRLEINKFRPRIGAVKKIQGTSRAPSFGRALHTVNDNDTFLYMMVNGNVDLFAGLFRGR
jgi:hypothetical protein